MDTCGGSGAPMSLLMVVLLVAMPCAAAVGAQAGGTVPMDPQLAAIGDALRAFPGGDPSQWEANGVAASLGSGVLKHMLQEGSRIRSTPLEGQAEHYSFPLLSGSGDPSTSRLAALLVGHGVGLLNVPLGDPQHALAVAAMHHDLPVFQEAARLVEIQAEAGTLLVLPLHDPPGPPSLLHLLLDEANHLSVDVTREWIAHGIRSNDRIPSDEGERMATCVAGSDLSSPTVVQALCAVEPVFLEISSRIIALAHVLQRHGLEAADIERITGVPQGQRNSHQCCVDGFGVTPLHFAARAGMSHVAAKLVDIGIGLDIQAERLYMQTALHLAVSGVWYEIVHLLIRHGASASLASEFGASALQYAEQLGDPALYTLLAPEGSAMPRNREFTGGCDDVLGLRTQAPSYPSSSGGWLGQRKLSREQHAVLRSGLGNADAPCLVAQVDMLQSAISPREFFETFVVPGRPVLLKSALAFERKQARPGRVPWVQLKKMWKRKKLVASKRLKHVAFEASPIPYGEKFYGLGGNVTRQTIPKFVRKHMPTSRQRKSDEKAGLQPVVRPGSLDPPSYVFTSDANHLLRSNVPLQDTEDISMGPPNVDYPVILDSQAMMGYSSQFMLGPALSGAPPHVHNSAVNGVVYGTKIWNVFPPSQSMFSRTPVIEWLQNRLNRTTNDVDADIASDSASLISSANEPVFSSATQLEDDLLFLPSSWGHLVLNIGETVAIATEFMSPDVVPHYWRYSEQFQ